MLLNLKPIKMKNVIKTILLAFTICSCASFRTRIVRNVKAEIAPTELSVIDGTYSMNPSNYFNEKGESYEPNYKTRLNMYHYLRLSDSEADSLANYQVTIKTLKNNLIQCVLKKDDVSIDSVEIRGSLRSNGMFHFKDNELECFGIPYILGGCSQSKVRIGISKNNELLINSAYNSEAALLILFGNSMSYNSAFSFSRI